MTIEPPRPGEPRLRRQAFRRPEDWRAPVNSLIGRPMHRRGCPASMALTITKG